MGFYVLFSFKSWKYGRRRFGEFYCDTKSGKLKEDSVASMHERISKGLKLKEKHVIVHNIIKLDK